MTGWLIFAGILAVLLFLLLSPLRVGLTWKEEDLDIAATYLFLRFDLSPEAIVKRLADKKTGPAAEEIAKEEEAPEGAEAVKKKNKAPSVAELGMDLLRSSRRARGILKRHIILDKIRLQAAICGEDAHKTALAFSSFWGGVTAALTLMGLLCTLKSPDLAISPDFTGQRSRYDLSLRLGVRPLFLVEAALSLLFRFLLLQFRKSGKHPRKDGKRHEPTTAPCQ